MVSMQELQSLVTFLSEDPLVLSLYLNVDTTRRTKEKYRLSLRNLLKQVDGEAASKDIAAVERFFDFEYDGTSRSVIIFSCQEGGLWEVFPLAVPIEDRVVVARRPFITPLQDVLDEYARYGVIFVDREGARLLLFNLGELEEAEGTLGDELKRHKQGGWAAQRLQRRADEIAAQNFKEIVEAARRFCDENLCTRIILAGTGDNVATFRGMLPKSMRDMIVGEMALDMTAGEVEIREKTMGIIRDHMRAEETTLVKRMITSAAKGETGAIGLVDTLHALQEDRVHILLVSEGYEAQGFRCTHCGYVGARELDACPYCGSEVRVHDHVIDAAVRLAIEKGVAVKIIGDNEQLDTAGSIGAILRY